VQYVTDHSIILKYVFGFDKLLIFPSVLLPEQILQKSIYSHMKYLEMIQILQKIQRWLDKFYIYLAILTEKD